MQTAQGALKGILHEIVGFRFLADQGTRIAAKRGISAAMVSFVSTVASHTET